jgi:hypothetical protein
VALAALSVFTREFGLLVDVMDIDEASYAVAAREMLRGRLLYTDVADHHPPLVYVYYALVRLLFGGGVREVRLVTTLVVVPLIAWALSAFYRHDRRGRAAAVLFVVYSAAYVPHDMLAVNGELLMLLPACWALVLARDEAALRSPVRGLGAGALIGTAVLFKYQAGLWLPVLLLEMARADRRRRGAPAIAASLAGFAVPLAAAYACFAARGGAAQFVYWNLTHNLGYAANPIRPVRALARLATGLLPFVAVTAGLWWSAARSRSFFDEGPQRRLVHGLVAASAVAAALGFRFYPHYFMQLYPPLALAAAPFAAELFLPPWPLAARVWAASTFALLAGFTVAGAFMYFGQAPLAEEAKPVFPAVADRLKVDPCYEGGSLFVWGYAPLFYYDTDLALGSRFMFPEATLVGYVPGNPDTAYGRVDTRRYVRPEHWDLLMHDLETKRPTYILDTSAAGIHHWRRFPLERFPRLAGFVEANYGWIDSVQRVGIYRRKGCTAEARRSN